MEIDLNYIRGYKIELEPNKLQKAALMKVTAAQRKAYNYCLDKALNYKEVSGKFPTLGTIKSYNKNFTDLKKTDSNFQWFNDVSKCAHQSATLNLASAFSRFYENLAEEPNFKSARRSKRSFNFDNVGFKVSDNRRRIKIPTIGYVKLKEKNYFPKGIFKFLSFTVSEHANKWYISFTVEHSDTGEFTKFNKHKTKHKKHEKISKAEIIRNSPNSNLEVIGNDLGIATHAQLSNGKSFNFSEKIKEDLNIYDKRYKKLQRKYSHQTKGRKNPKNKIGIARCNDFIKNNVNNSGKKFFSRNSYRTLRRMAVLRKKALDLKLDAMHKITTGIVKRRAIILVCEDLKVQNMMKNHNLAKSIANVSWGEMTRQLKYKSKLVGGLYYEVDTFYPSSKLCSCCGHKKEEIKLSTRIYCCEVCGMIMDRDLNAAINIRNFYLKNKVPIVGRELGS